MKLLFKQRFFSWLDSYDVFDLSENIVYSVKGELAFGHCLRIFDSYGREKGMVKEKILTFLPSFEIFLDGERIGSISREFSLFTPKYNVDYNGWHIEGDFMEWDYDILGPNGEHIASISKELFKFTDTYTIDVENPDDALLALMFVLAIDAEKCSRNN